ncbi:MAG: DUF3159 domain-containing protein [Actinomycetaceae bacterium]|nr:DUF3159 domain-containing protein [Actinomycetaceae bacterium]
MTEENKVPRATGSLGAIVADDFNVMKAVGGGRGITESVLPTVLFLIIFALRADLMMAIGVAVAAALILIVARAVQRIDVTPALGGLFAVGLSAFMAWRTGQASDFFVWGLLVNLAYLAGILISLLIRWPIIGVFIGFLRGDATSWRKDPEQKLTASRYTLITWLWAGMFAARAAVQLPLYFADATGALGIAKLAMGIPLFALIVWFSWLLVRGLPEVQPVVAENADD